MVLERQIRIKLHLDSMLFVCVCVCVTLFESVLQNAKYGKKHAQKTLPHRQRPVGGGGGVRRSGGECVIDQKEKKRNKQIKENRDFSRGPLMMGAGWLDGRWGGEVRGNSRQRCAFAHGIIINKNFLTPARRGMRRGVGSAVDFIQLLPRIFTF